MIDLLVQLLWLAALSLAATAVFCFRLRRIAAIGAVGAVLLAYSVLSPAPVWLQVVLWIAFASAAVVIGHDGLRRELPGRLLLRLFRKALPKMSDSERIAIEAGSVSWEGELFTGAPDWAKLMEQEPAQLSPEESAFLEGPVNTLCAMLDDWRITSEGRLPPPVWDYLREKKFFGIIIPKEHGGLGFSALAHSCIVMKIAGRSVAAAVTAMVPNSLGPGKLILEYGTPEQRRHYLPRLARGDDIPCFALTGPQAGSDASNIPDTGVVCRGHFNGREVLGVRLNWDKRYITLAPVATLLGLAFRLRDPQHLLGDKGDVGITLALIPVNTPGVEIGGRHLPLNVAFMNGPTRGRDVFIPLDWIIGGADGAGDGWRMLMECLADGRAISLPALATAACKTACFATGAYARIRNQFHLPIGEFEGVAEALARIAGNTWLADAARSVVTEALQQGHSPAIASAITKYHLTERMRQVANDAMDVHGGSGICLGPRNHVARLYQAAPIGITVEGANILTRSMMVFGQGAIRCHPWLLKEIEAAAQDNDDDALQAFDAAFWGHLSQAATNAGRCLVWSVFGRWLIRVPPGLRPARHFRALTRMSAMFALATDFALLRVNRSLKRREHLSARLGDMLSYLYLASMALKHFNNRHSPWHERPLLDWAVLECTRCFHRALNDLLDNFPGRWTALKLRWLVYPLGRRVVPENDELNDRVARLPCEPSPARDALIEGLFTPEEQDDPLFVIADALNKVVAAAIPEKKLRGAQRAGDLPNDVVPDLALALEKNIISNGEADLIRKAREARDRVIAVDEFAADAPESRPASAGAPPESRPNPADAVSEYRPDSVDTAPESRPNPVDTPPA